MKFQERFTTWACHHWPEVVAGLVPVLAYAHIVFAGQVMYWGLPALQFVPWRVLANEAFLQGHLPLWTPLLGMGAPILANHQSAVLYPPNWLALVLPPEMAVSILAVLHLSFAGVGMVRLARRLGLNNFGAAITGLSFGMAGYLTGRLWFVTINNAVSWLPWIVLASTPVISPAGRAGAKRFLVLTALIALQLLSGHAQTTFYTLLLAGAWLAAHSLFLSPVSSRAVYQTVLRNLAVFGLACTYAIALTAIQIIPTAELLSLSTRADAAGYEFAMTYSLWPWRILTFLMPNLFGNPATGNYWGYGTFWEDHAYMGLLPFVFALYSLRNILAQKQWEPTNRIFRFVSVFGLVTALVSILLALGQNTPIFPFLYRYVPGFDLFQAPARMLIWYTFAVSLMAGVGAHSWQASERKRYWARLSTAGGLGIVVLGLAGWYVLRFTLIGTFGIALVYFAVIVVLAAMLLLKQPASARRWQRLAVGLVALDLALAGVPLTPTTHRSLYQFFESANQSDGRLFQYELDEYNVRFHELFLFKAFYPLNTASMRSSNAANFIVLSHTATVNNFDPLRTARYVNYINAMETSPQLMQLANVSVIVKRNGAVTPAFFEPAKFRIVYDSQSAASEADALAAISEPAFDPNTTVILESAPASSLPGLTLDPHTVSTTLTLDRDGYVVFSESYYPGWRVYVDDAPQPLIIADYAFKTVAVPAGIHTIRFEYAPTSVTIGLIISALAIVLFILLVVWGRAQK